MLVGKVCRAVTPFGRANVARGPPLPAPPRAPPPSAPRWGRAVSRLWRGVFVRGAPRPPPLRSAPCAPPPAPPSLGCGGVLMVWWCQVVVCGVRCLCVSRRLYFIAVGAVGGAPSGPSWPRCARSALNGPSWGSPSLPVSVLALRALSWLGRVCVGPCAPRSPSALGRFAPLADGARCALVLSHPSPSLALRTLSVRFLSFRHDISLFPQLNNVKVLLPLCSILVNTSVSLL